MTLLTEFDQIAVPVADQYLIYRIEAECYAIKVVNVSEIRSWEAVARVPNTPASVKGILNLTPGKLEQAKQASIRWRGFRYVDPDKELKAIVQEVDSGLRSRSDIVMSTQGREYEDVLAEKAADAELENLPRLLQNYVAAAVEQAAVEKSVMSPTWVDAVEPPARPNFAWDLPSLRPHLMRVTPLAFKRRNVFIALVGDARR